MIHQGLHLHTHRFSIGCSYSHHTIPCLSNQSWRLYQNLFWDVKSSRRVAAYLSRYIRAKLTPLFRISVGFYLFSAPLTSLDLRSNELDESSKELVRGAAKEGMSLPSVFSKLANAANGLTSPSFAVSLDARLCSRTSARWDRNCLRASLSSAMGGRSG